MSEPMERTAFLAACRYAIAVCKQEVEKVPGVTACIGMSDDGSPWGRAFIRCCDEKVAALLAEHEWARLAAAACVLYCSENGHEQTDEIDRAVGFEVDENCE